MTTHLDELRAMRAAQGLVVANASRGKHRDKHLAVYRGLDALIQRAEFLEDDTTYTIARPATPSLSRPLPPLTTLTDDECPF